MPSKFMMLRVTQSLKFQVFRKEHLGSKFPFERCEKEWAKWIDSQVIENSVREFF